LKASEHAKKELGLTISLTAAGHLVGYTKDGLYKMFNNPKDIGHQKFNQLIREAQKKWKESIR